MAVPGARDWLLDRKIVPDDVGLELVDDTREFLERLEPRALAEFLIGGLATVDITGGFDDDHFALAEYSPDAREYVMPPLPNTLYTRDTTCWLYGGVTLNPLYFPARHDETLLMKAVYQFHPDVRRLDRVVGRPRAALGSLHHRGRRRHAGRQRHRARRDERAHVAPGHHPAGRRAVRAGRGRARRRRRDAPAACGDAPRHRVHLRGPRRGDALPEDRRRDPRVHPASRRRRPRAHHRRGHGTVRRRRRSARWTCPGSA